jgi:hypothetical protein
MAGTIVNDGLLRALNARVKNLGVQPVRSQDEIQVEHFMNNEFGFESGKGLCGRACPNVPNTAYYMCPGKGSFNNWSNYWDSPQFKKAVDFARFQGIQLHTETGLADKVDLTGMKFPVAPHGEIQLLDSCKRDVQNRAFVLVLDPRHFPTKASYMTLVAKAFEGGDFLPAITVSVNNNETARGFVVKMINHYAELDDPSYAGTWGTVLDTKPLIIAAAIAKRRLYIRVARKAAFWVTGVAAIAGTDAGTGANPGDWVAVRNARHVQGAISFPGTDLAIKTAGHYPRDDYADLVKNDKAILMYEKFLYDAIDTLSNIPRFEASSATVQNGVFSAIGLSY